MQIGACLAAELPVITLSATGYVSTYDHEDACDSRTFTVWNPIEGRKTMPANPGQFLSQKLESVIQERKKTNSWEVDAWAEWTKTADFGPPDEAIVVGGLKGGPVRPAEGQSEIGVINFCHICT